MQQIRGRGFGPARRRPAVARPGARNACRAAGQQQPEAYDLPVNAHLRRLQRLQAAAHHHDPRRRAGAASAPASTAAISSARRCRPMRRASRWSIRRRSAPNMRTSRPARASASSIIRSTPTPARRASARSSPRIWSRPASTMRSSSPSTTPPPKGVEAKDKQICVEGLEHGQHYDVDLPRRPAGGDRRGDRRPGRAVDLHPGPRAVRPLHRRQLRAAGRRAPRHPGRHRQHGRRRDEALPHRRPLAGAASVRLPVPAPARRLRHLQHFRPDGRAGLARPARHRQRPQQGSHHLASRSTRRCRSASPASMC